MVEPTELSTPDEVVAAMDRALDGDREAAAWFYREILSLNLYVPDRFQPTGAASTADYPHDLVYVLGMKTSAGTTVPAFTHLSFLNEWSGAPLSYRVMAGRRLFEAVPDDWLVVLNPGQAVEKEFSPWEIGHLRSGEGALPEILAELFSLPEATGEVRMSAPANEEIASLTETLAARAQSYPDIKTLYVIRESLSREDESDPGSELTTLLIGVAVAPEAAHKLEALTEIIRGAAEVHQIGGESVKVFGGVDDPTNLMLQMFRNVDPFFQRAAPSRPLWQRLFSRALPEKANK